MATLPEGWYDAFDALLCHTCLRQQACLAGWVWSWLGLSPMLTLRACYCTEALLLITPFCVGIM